MTDQQIHNALKSYLLARFVLGKNMKRPSKAHLRFEHAYLCGIIMALHHSDPSWQVPPIWGICFMTGRTILDFPPKQTKQTKTTT